MTLLSKLFKKRMVVNPASNKKEQAITVEQSIASLDQLPADDVVNIAVGEKDPELRIAAIAKLPYGEALKSLAFHQNASKVQVSARVRIADLVDQGDIGFKQVSEDVSDKVALLAIASFSNQTQLQENVLNEATDDSLLYKVASEGASAKLRQVAAQRISDRKMLEQLLKQSKGKDKTIYRIAKDKCELFKEQDKQKEKVKKELESLCVAMEKLSKRAFDPMFNANFNHFKDQWSAFQKQDDIEISNAFHERMEQAQVACQLVVEEQEKIEAEEEQQRQAVASAANDRDKILIELQQVMVSLYSSDIVSSDSQDKTTSETETAAVLSLLQQNWRQSVSYLPASSQQMKKYTQLCEAVLLLQSQLTQYGPLNQHQTQVFEAEKVSGADVQILRKRLKTANLLIDDQCPEIVTTVKKRVKDWDQKQLEEKNNAQQFNRQVSGLIRRASDAIERGQVRQAVGIHRSIEQKLADVKKVPTGLSEQLARLNEKIGQLQDWRSYAVQPKIEELVQQMQVLIDSKLSPDVLAEKIKNLQEQWKLLSKGGGGQYQEQWDEFHQLAQTAYEPCKVYFQKQANNRQENLQKRKNLVSQLSEFFDSYNWDTADWRLVEKMARVARQEWRNYSPTDRAATKSVQLAFNEQLDSIQKKLDGEYKKNALVREHLIEQAKLLTDSDDFRTSVEQVKNLQAQWKSSGVVSRKVDQALWQEFRRHCDAVFEKRQQQSEEFKAQLNVSKDQAQKICDDIEALSQLSGAALLEARSELVRLQTEFKELGTMPKNSANAINSKFAAAVEAFELAIVNERKQAKAIVWDNLLAANSAVAHYEAAVIEDDQVEEVKIATQNAIDTITQWPKGGREVIDKKFQQAANASSIDYPANEAALRLLCIRMEILAGSETPETDTGIRMEYQVNRLQDGLGQKVIVTEAILADLIFEWVAIPSITTYVYDALLERFDHCRKLLA